MKLSRKWMYCAAAVPLVGAAGWGIWKSSQLSTGNAAATQMIETKAAETTVPPIAVSTKPGAPVNRVENLTCEVTQGWPVILVRDANDHSPWWVQGRAERQEAQTYSARAHFGNDTTKPGQRYQIVVLSAEDEWAARQYETGTTLDEFPADLPHSDPIEVVRR
ncbi:MAG: hypothetical protein ACKV2Q_29740 [Planctomycetaceae bacterium]